MTDPNVIVVGGGAAGFFAAITAAETGKSVELLEKGPEFLAKVRISGGGRCNVTHACFEPRDFSTRYPRGRNELIGPFQRFHAEDTVAWFAARGVELKTEPDGRMFPVTDKSRTIVDCLVNAATEAGVKLRARCGVDSIQRPSEGGFALTLSNGETRQCGRLVLATGGCRTPALGRLAESLGHTLTSPVPSLFTFHINLPWLHALAGVSVDEVEVAVPESSLRERGPLLITHWGLSGPVILRVSAWGARELHQRDYNFPVDVHWLPGRSENQLSRDLDELRKLHGARLVTNAPLPPLGARLWEQLVLASGVGPGTRWASATRSQLRALLTQLIRTRFQVNGKSMNKEEFVTCGGVRLEEVNFKTMESRLCPGLYFAGELLDIDGITGGFNFQAAWTTGWLAGQAR